MGSRGLALVAVSPLSKGRGALAKESAAAAGDDRRDRCHSAGFIWIASATRVVRVARERLLQGDVSDADVREYGVPDGLQSTEGVRRYRSAVADASGRVWLSLGHGLSMTDPSRRAATAPVRLTHVESVLADGPPMSLDGPVRVPAGPQRLTFAYTG